MEKRRSKVGLEGNLGIPVPLPPPATVVGLPAGAVVTITPGGGRYFRSADIAACRVDVGRYAVLADGSSLSTLQYRVVHTACNHYHATTLRCSPTFYLSQFTQE